jgi:hypothetical protein
MSWFLTSAMRRSGPGTSDRRGDKPPNHGPASTPGSAPGLAIAPRMPHGNAKTARRRIDKHAGGLPTARKAVSIPDGPPRAQEKPSSKRAASRRAHGEATATPMALPGALARPDRNARCHKERSPRRHHGRGPISSAPPVVIAVVNGSGNLPHGAHRVVNPPGSESGRSGSTNAVSLADRASPAPLSSRRRSTLRAVSTRRARDCCPGSGN